MITWAKNLLPRRLPVIRLRMPATMRIFPGSDHEAINATFDEGGRIVQLIVHTKNKSLGTSHWS